MLDEILDLHLAFFNQHGYKLIRDKNQFRKTTTNGFHNVIFSVSEYQDITIMDVHLGVRLDVVEGLVYQFTNGLPGFSQDSNTFMTSVGRLRQRPHFRYQFRNRQEMDAARIDLELFMETEGFELMEQLSTLEGLDIFLNSRPEKPSPYIYNQVNRVLRGLAVARLLHKPGFNELFEAYKKLLKKKGTPPQMMDRVNHLATLLHTFSLN